LPELAFGFAKTELPRQERAMKTLMETYRHQMDRQRQKGGIGWLLLWLIGVPIPVLIVLFLLRGCT
jgi:hypothetical protein